MTLEDCGKDSGGNAIRLRMNVEGGGDTRGSLEIETVGSGEKLI